MKKKINFCLAMLAVLLMSSCVTELGAFKYYNKHPDQLAQICASKFPVETKFIPGEPEVTRDTVYEKGDSIPCPEVTDPRTGEKSTPKVKCPDRKTIYNNTVTRDTIYQENTAKVKVLEDKYSAELRLRNEIEGKFNAAKIDLAEAKKSIAKHNILHGIALLVIVALSFLLYRR